MVVASSETFAQEYPLTGCSIKYDHDAAGNRTSRYWYCWGLSPMGGSLDSLSNDSLPGGGKSQLVLEEIGLSLHPNPATTSVWLILSAPVEDAHYAILDMNGRIVRQGRLAGDRMNIDLAGLAPGPYHARVFAHKELLSRIFIVE